MPPERVRSAPIRVRGQSKPFARPSYSAHGDFLRERTAALRTYAGATADAEATETLFLNVRTPAELPTKGEKKRLGDAGLSLVALSPVDPNSAIVQLRRRRKRASEPRVLPGALVCDNGSEFTSRMFDAWAYRRAIKLLFIRPGKPVENAFIGSFNGKLRDECLSANWFLDLADAQLQSEQWRRDHNEARPHSSLADKTPKRFAKAFAFIATSTDP